MHRVLLATSLTLAVAGATAAAQTGASTDIVADVRAAIADEGLDQAEALLARDRATRGDTPEAAAALSWLGRGALAAGQLDRARQYAIDAYDLGVRLLGSGALDDEPHLQTAIGASIEVRAIVQAEQGARSDAVYFLQRELAKYADTGIHKRIQKNANLLSLEGQPAPPLVALEVLDGPVPSFEELRGNVVLLFFWAHWCSDCKAQSPIVARLLDKYGPQGFAVVAPTQRFGYIVDGEDTSPDDELRHIVSVRDTYYAFLRDRPVPVSDVNHKRYGVSSTPTLVLVDRQGLVRMYRPGRVPEDELDARIRDLLAEPVAAARQ